jgi:hypothetical protein
MMQDYRDLLNSQLAEAFPDLADFLPPSTSSAVASHQIGNGIANGVNADGDVKMEEVR